MVPELFIGVTVAVPVSFLKKRGHVVIKPPVGPGVVEKINHHVGAWECSSKPALFEVVVNRFEISAGCADKLGLFVYA